jgi:hypothetical protein
LEAFQDWATIQKLLVGATQFIRLDFYTTSLHGSVLTTMATKTKCDQVVEFIVSKLTAVFEMMNLKITH